MNKKIKNDIPEEALHKKEQNRIRDLQQEPMVLCGIDEKQWGQLDTILLEGSDNIHKKFNEYFYKHYGISFLLAWL